MARLESRLRAVERLTDGLIVEMLVEREIQEMLRVLKANKAIEPPLYAKVERIITTAKGR